MCVCGHHVYQQVWEAAVKKHWYALEKRESVMTDMLWLWKSTILTVIRHLPKRVTVFAYTLMHSRITEAKPELNINSCDNSSIT